ncbi:MAG: tRNA/rRNA methyltransferase [Alphaproteobacteria bacterium]|jgi:tRNA/rRNA methyltransferase|nr:tRNA/rRNA methyltransferase [Alphaproteobacteria bacterium]
MPGSGTDRTKDWVAGGPIVILVEPQLGDNIGATARAMANFGLSRLRLVKPRDGWPNPRAWVAASGADRVLDEAGLFDTVEAAIADCSYVLATTARAHDQAKPVVSPEQAAREMAPRIAAGEAVGVLFGRERYGLENTEVALADRTVTLPVNPAFASLNLAQAVLVVAYEWFKLVSGGELPFTMPQKSEPVTKEQLMAFFANVERELDKVEFFRPPEKHETMTINLRNIFHRMQPTRQDIQTLQGVIMAIAEGRKGPAKGGVLDGEEAEMLRALLAEHEQKRTANEKGPVRGLSRLLRRNPTDAERLLWDALTKDRRFAGHGFKRQTPVGRHITDLVSFPLRLVVDLVPDGESEAVARQRDEKRAWLSERDYRVIVVRASEVEANVDAVLDALAAEIARS